MPEKVNAQAGFLRRVPHLSPCAVASGDRDVRGQIGESKDRCNIRSQMFPMCPLLVDPTSPSRFADTAGGSTLRIRHTYMSWHC